MRTMALTFTNPVDAAFAYSLYFGTLLPVDLIVKSSSRKPPIISPMLLGEPKKYLSLARTYPTHPKSDKT